MAHRVRAEPAHVDHAHGRVGVRAGHGHTDLDLLALSVHVGHLLPPLVPERLLISDRAQVVHDNEVLEGAHALLQIQRVAGWTHRVTG